MVVGGAASGKSRFAENLCISSGLPRFYVATAQAFDQEMRDKVAQHRVQRGTGWTTIEEPFALTQVLRERRAGEIVLVDCLTLWLTNVMLDERDVGAETAALLEAIAACPARLVIVSNEVGAGIVPENALVRRFRGAQGRLNQQVAAACDTVVTVIAGLPLALKGTLG